MIFAARARTRPERARSVQIFVSGRRLPKKTSAQTVNLQNPENVMLLLPAASCASATALAWLAVSALTVSPARAHQAPTGWTYPWACCSNLDCREVEAKTISEKPQGYVIQSTGEVVAYGDKRVKDSPDGEYRWCAHQTGIDAGHTICLLVPPKSF